MELKRYSQSRRITQKNDNELRQIKQLQQLLSSQYKTAKNIMMRPNPNLTILELLTQTVNLTYDDLIAYIKQTDESFATLLLEREAWKKKEFSEHINSFYRRWTTPFNDASLSSRTSSSNALCRLAIKHREATAEYVASAMKVHQDKERAEEQSLLDAEITQQYAHIEFMKKQRKAQLDLREAQRKLEVAEARAQVWINNDIEKPSTFLNTEKCVNQMDGEYPMSSQEYGRSFNRFDFEERPADPEPFTPPFNSTLKLRSPPQEKFSFKYMAQDHSASNQGHSKIRPTPRKRSSLKKQNEDAIAHDLIDLSPSPTETNPMHMPTSNERSSHDRQQNEDGVAHDVVKQSPPPTEKNSKMRSQKLERSFPGTTVASKFIDSQKDS